MIVRDDLPETPEWDCHPRPNRYHPEPPSEAPLGAHIVLGQE